MAHPRTEIREAVIALLVNATAAGSRVEDSRVDPIGSSKLPLISVYTLHEPVDTQASKASAPRTLEREVKVEIAAWVAHSDAVPAAKAMDNIALQIEAAMDANRYIADLVSDSVLEDTELEIRVENGRSDPLVGCVVMTYSVTYQTRAITTLADDFITVGATHKFVTADDDNAPKDEFVVQETTP